MLRITSDTRIDSKRLILAGRLVRPWVNEVERSWDTLKQSEPRLLVVDLKGITFIDEDGKALISRMWKEGAQLVVTGSSVRAFIEDITPRSEPATHEETRTEEP